MKGVGILGRWWSSGPRRVSMLDGYAKWAPMYPPRPHNPLMEAEATIVGQLFRAAAPRRALDVGTGTGRNLEMLRAAGAVTIAGVDLSPSMLCHGSGVFPLTCGDAQRLPFRSASFDLVSSSLMCGDLRDLDPWIAEASRVLTRGGHLIYSDFHPEWSVAGWRRTFTGDDGQTYELPLHPHTIDDHVQLLNTHGMQVRAIREPRIAGRTAPVVVVLHAVKSDARAC
jgi:SAM-dependent methyltransferase